MKRRKFIKTTALIPAIPMLPSILMNKKMKISGMLHTAHIGVGGMGLEDLKALSSHEKVKVFGLCDVDSNQLNAAHQLFPEAKIYADYRLMLKELENDIHAVVVSTPDHTHAPASLMAMEMNKAVYCQKPLTHHVSEARAMHKMAEEKKLVTQMGIQVHSFYDYKLATLLIQSGIIGKVHTVHAWSPKNWGFDGPAPVGNDHVPTHLDWNLWLGTSPERPYKDGYYHPGNWRKIMDYGCGTLGDMGVHIFDTPYNALALDVPETIITNCRKPNGFGFPEKNTVTYTFPGTAFTAEKLTWIWYDGDGAPAQHDDLLLPDQEVLHDQGAMFVGDQGNLYLPHFQILPKLIQNGKYVEIDVEKFGLGAPVRSYASEGPKHYHEFVDACLDQGKCSAPFSYGARLTETILLGVIAGRFPNETLHWNKESGRFEEDKANQYLDSTYREF